MKTKSTFSGYLAGLVSATRTQKLGALGGIPIVSVQRFIHGFGNGVKASCPTCQVFCDYSESFSNDNNEGEAKAEKFLQVGVDVLFAAAGVTGSAAIKKAAAQVRMEISFPT